MSKQVYKKWNDENNPSAYSGADIYKKENPHISKQSLLNKYLPSIPTYQKYRSKKPVKVYNPFFVYKKRIVIQSDLLHMLHPPNIIKDNNGYSYILVVQDIFSRKIWVRALKNKQASTVLPAFKDIIKLMKPFSKKTRLVIDRGTEYLNARVKAMLNDEKISISHTSDGHASHVERAILSLQRLLYQHIEAKGGKTLSWLPFLQKAADIMNGRYHRIIKMSPDNAERAENENKVNEAMSLYRQKAFDRERKRKGKKMKFRKNDFVRLQRWKNKFARGYDKNFTTEVFKISKVLNHLPITMYTVIDAEKNEIKGNFYAEELSLVEGSIFLIEKIIKKKKINNQEWGLIKWEGFPHSENTWEKLSDII